MALALDTNSTGGGASATISCNSGDVLLCAFVTSAAVTGCSDNSGHTNAWQQLAVAVGGGFNLALYWTVANANITSATVTGAGGSPLATQVSTWSGGNTASPFDGSAVVSNASNTQNVTTTGSNEILYQCGCSGSGGGFGVGFTQIEFSNFTTTEYQTQATAGTYTLTNQGNGSIGSIGVALVPGSAGAAFKAKSISISQAVKRASYW